MAGRGLPGVVVALAAGLLSPADVGSAAEQTPDPFLAAIRSCRDAPTGSLAGAMALLGAQPLPEAELDRLLIDYVRDVAAGTTGGGTPRVSRIEDHSVPLMVFEGFRLTDTTAGQPAGQVTIVVALPPGGPGRRCEITAPGDRLEAARILLAASHGAPETEISVANGTMLVWPALLGPGAEEFALLVTLPGRAYTLVRMFVY